MHQPEQLRTLIACIDDLTRTVEALHKQGAVHRADQDLLLYHARLFYEALLDLPVAKAEMPVAAAPAPTPTEVNQAAEAPAPVVESLEEVIEAAVEEVMATGDTIEMDIEQSLGPELEEAEAAVEALSELVTASTHAAPEATKLAAAATPGTEAAPAAAETAAAPEPEMETKEEAAPAPAPEGVVPSSPTVAPAPHRSVAFSLTGIIERSGDSQLVMAHLKLKPIDDLKSGIGLNEKFLFIRELFNNDHLAYAEAIEKLNAATSLQQAEQILGEQLLPNYQWDLETEATMSFLHLIFRRFGH